MNGLRRRSTLVAGCFLLNALIWAIGNSFAGSTLLVYFVTGLGVANVGLTISAIKASPQIAGVLRLATPWFLRRFAHRFRIVDSDVLGQRFTLVSHGLSVLILAVFPWIAMGMVHWTEVAEKAKTESVGIEIEIENGLELWTPGIAVGGIVLVWCVHHLLEYLGTVVLWSWTGERIPAKRRRRFFGLRNAALSAGFFVGGLGVWHLRNLLTNAGNHAATAFDYALIAGTGTCFLGLAIVPLIFVPNRKTLHSLELVPTESDTASIVGTTETPSTTNNADPTGTTVDTANSVESTNPPNPPGDSRGILLRNVFRNMEFRGILLYGILMSVTGGVVQAAQYLFAIRYLGIPFVTTLMLDATMRVGQMVLSPAVGRWLTRWGYRRVLVPSTLILAGCYAMFLLATPERPMAYYCGWAMYLAWTGVNIGIPARLVEFGDESQRPAFIGCYHSLTGGFLAIATLLGGVLLDLLLRTTIPQLTILQGFLIVGVFGRFLAALRASTGTSFGERRDKEERCDNHNTPSRW